MIPTKRPSLFQKGDQEGDIAAIDPKLQRLLQICEISDLPAVHTMMVCLDSIIVPSEESVKPAAGLIRNIKLVGIRQPPSVAWYGGSAWDADDATYMVVMGRRRIASVRKLLASGDLRFKTIKCEVYERNEPRLNAFLGLVENEQRGASWVQDVIRLRQLITEGVAMTLDDLADYGFNRRTLRGRLDIAQLPQAILDQICAGNVSLDVAMQISRLKDASRELLMALVGAGEEITAELVQNLLRRQVNRGLTHVQIDLSQMWMSQGDQAAAPTLCEPLQEELGSALTPTQLLVLLRQFEPQIQSNAAMRRVGMLTKVLMKELEITLGQPSNL